MDVFEPLLAAYAPNDPLCVWPANVPEGTLGVSLGYDGELYIHRADPRIAFSAQLVDAIVDQPTERVFVDLTGCDTYMGALLKIYGANRNVVYRLTEWLPIHAFVGEFV